VRGKDPEGVALAAESLDRGALGEAGDVPDPYNLVLGRRYPEISLGWKRADMT
jgi:hypothetical protein